MIRGHGRWAALAAATLLAVMMPTANAQPEFQLPGLEEAVPAGELGVTPSEPRVPSVKVVDGDPSDWIGDRVGIGGAVTYSAGELIYEDFLFDAHGADDGLDTLVDNIAEPLISLLPQLDRPLDKGLLMAGILLNGYIPDSRPMHLGDAGMPAGRTESADLFEARFHADDDGLKVLARTGQMHADDDTAVVLLLDVDGSSPQRNVPFRTGLKSSKADVAVYLAATGSTVVDLHNGQRQPVESVAVNADGFTNTIEAEIPLSGPLAGADTIDIALATGYADGAGGLAAVGPANTTNAVNVAFRDEPVSVAMDHEQATMLHGRNIDATFTTLDLEASRSGATETAVPGPGYYEATFVSTTPGVADEDLPRQGAFQHYALYLPESWTPGTASPTTLWLHYGSGDTHHLGAFQGGLVRELGEARNNMLIGPSGRGPYTFYRGAAYADVMEVMADSARFGRDVDRTTIAGYSMGSYGTMMLTALHPDLFAGALGMDGTPPSKFDGWTRNRANSAAIPFVLMGGLAYVDMRPDYQSLIDAGGTARLYLYPVEHQTNVILDVWSELTSAIGQPVRDLTPEHVRYTRVPAIEAGVATMPNQEPMASTNPATVDVDADGAFWVDGIELRDAGTGHATVDATTDGWGHQPTKRVAESGLLSLGAVLPFVMEGVRHAPSGTPTVRSDSFEMTLTNVASVRFDMAGMGLCTGATATGIVHTDGPTTLLWDRPGQATSVVEVPAAGDHSVSATCAAV